MSTREQREKLSAIVTERELRAEVRDLKAQLRVLEKALRSIANGYDDGVGSSYWSGPEAADIASIALATKKK